MTIGRFQRREREQQQEGSNKLGPDEKRKTHPGQTRRAQLDDGGDEIDCAQQRRRNQKNKADEPERLPIKNGLKFGPVSAMTPSGV